MGVRGLKTETEVYKDTFLYEPKQCFLYLLPGTEKVYTKLLHVSNTLNITHCFFAEFASLLFFVYRAKGAEKRIFFGSIL